MRPNMTCSQSATGSLCQPVRRRAITRFVASDSAYARATPLLSLPLFGQDRFGWSGVS
jgi:hypothetical protein